MYYRPGARTRAHYHKKFSGIRRERKTEKWPSSKQKQVGYKMQIIKQNESAGGQSS